MGQFQQLQGVGQGESQEARDTDPDKNWSKELGITGQGFAGHYQSKLLTWARL